jgi:hypothetical protein
VRGGRTRTRDRYPPDDPLPECCAREAGSLLQAEKSKYTKQYIIDATDVPGHQIRIFEIHRTSPSEGAKYDGLRVVEEWIHGYSDYIDGNGDAWGYSTIVLENGDKIFTRYRGVSHTTVDASGSRRSVFTGVGHLVAGTGRVRGIEGALRATAIFDLKAGYNETRLEGQYWSR